MPLTGKKYTKAYTKKYGKVGMKKMKRGSHKASSHSGKIGSSTTKMKRYK